MRASGFVLGVETITEFIAPVAWATFGTSKQTEPYTVDSKSYPTISSHNLYVHNIIWRRYSVLLWVAHYRVLCLALTYPVLLLVCPGDLNA